MSKMRFSNFFLRMSTPKAPEGTLTSTLEDQNQDSLIVMEGETDQNQDAKPANPNSKKLSLGEEPTEGTRTKVSKLDDAPRFDLTEKEKTNSRNIKKVLVEFAIKHINTFISDNDFKDEILYEYPVPGSKTKKVMDSNIKSLLTECKATDALSLDKAFGTTWTNSLIFLVLFLKSGNLLKTKKMAQLDIWRSYRTSR